MPFIKEDKRSFLNRVKIFLNLKYSLREWGRSLATQALKRECSVKGTTLKATVWLHFYAMSRKDNSIEKQSRSADERFAGSGYCFCSEG